MPDDDSFTNASPQDVQRPYAGPTISFEEHLRQMTEAWADGSVPENMSVEAEWAKRSGLTPIEFLCDAYRNPFNPMKERINAAKSVMEYVHKKIAAELKVKGDASAPLMVAKMDVSRLSDEELVLLAGLLEKVGAQDTAGLGQKNTASSSQDGLR